MIDESAPGCTLWRRGGRRLARLGWLAVAQAAACAALPATEGADTTSLSTTVSAPTAPTPVAGQAGSPVTVTQTTAEGPGKAASVPGMSLRWHQNKLRCLSRTLATPTANDRIVLAACASDVRQQFAVGTLGQLSINTNFCVAQPNNTQALGVYPCAGAGAASMFMVFSARGSSPLLSNVSGPMTPLDRSGPLGGAVVINANQPLVDAAAVWDFVGVGNVGGTLMHLGPSGSSGQCLVSKSGAPALAACNASVAEQRWRYDGGLLISDTGKCLDCDMPGRACALKDCATVSSTTDGSHRWAYAVTFSFTAADGNQYSLGGRADTGSVALAEPNSTFFTFGALP